MAIFFLLTEGRVKNFEPRFPDFQDSPAAEPHLRKMLALCTSKYRQCPVHSLPPPTDRDVVQPRWGEGKV